MISFLPESTVVVVQGTHKGMIGMVLGSGHGFFTIQLENGNVIHKRATELEQDHGTSRFQRPIESLRLETVAGMLMDLSE